jgi:amino acid adenylation domain-containing protein
MLEDAWVGVALTERNLEERPPAFWGQTVCLDEEWEQIAEESEGRPERRAENGWREVGGENLAYVIYTSGSSGRPKGVMINHGGLSNYLKWASEAYGMEEGEGAPVNSSIGFDLTVTSLYLPLINGKSVNLLPEEEGIEGLARSLSEERGYSLVKITPAHLEVLEQQFGEREVEGGARALVIGGEELRAGRLKYWRERARGTRLINEYGPTETVVGCCVYEVNGREDGNEAAPIGRPIANTQMYILDQKQNPAPVGVRGDIYISGTGLARGYLRSPELTGEKFIPNRFSQKPGERCYQTGDLGRYRSDGNIEFLGRADDQVKVRGYRIELGEIEAVLNEHRSVKQSLVIASEDERGVKRLIGYVVGEEGATSAELKRHVRERLPEYMAPEAIVVLEGMPLTANGKIDRKRLPPVGDAGRQVEQEYVAPQTPLEEMVVGIFGEVLRLDRVGISDNFFELGGHSLLAIQVISRVRHTFGVEIGMRSIFDAPTAEGLSRNIVEAMGAGEKAPVPPLVRVEREGQRGWRAPLSFAQQRLWFIDRLNPGSAVYNIPGAVRLKGGLNLDVLERVINEVVRRHEPLRTRFEVEEGELVQMIGAWEPRRLDVVDLSGLSQEERNEEVGRRAREEAGTGFDLSRGPLLRVKVLKLEEEDYLVLYTMHHIVSDGWSMGILIREVGTLYQAYRADEESPLPELEIQYADYAVWQRAYLAGGVLENEVGYWREQLNEAAVLGLPADRPRPPEPSYRGGRRNVWLGQRLSEELKTLSRREGATLFMTLMAAFKVLLMRYSGQEDISVGTAIANRTRREVEGLIGFFVNTLVMRTDLSGNPSFRELVRREREVALGAYAHQEVPFEKLVEELNPARDLSQSPLFQVMMVLQNEDRETLELPGVKLSGFSDGVETGVERQTAKFDLTLEMMDLGPELAGSMEYSRDLFEAGTIERLINHYKNVLERVAKDSETPIWSLDLLSEEERKQIVEEWNATKADYPADKLIHELFEEQVERSSDAVALVYQEQSLTYEELNACANRLAHHLRTLGVCPESRVAICLNRGPEMVVAMLATLKAGGAYTPLDSDHPSDRLAYMLEDSAPVVLLTQGASRAALAAHNFWVSAVDLDTDAQQWAENSKDNLELAGAGLNAQSLAYILYTSGSTGRPKGVMINHGGLANYLRWAGEAYRVEEGEGAPVNSSISFDLAVTSLYLPLINGRCVNLLSEEEEVEALAEALSEKRGYSLVKITPAHLEALEHQLGNREVRDGARALVIGGEELRFGRLKYWLERAKGTRLINEYGPTETVVGCCVYEVDGSERESEAAPIGRPIANTQIFILNQDQEPAPVGVRGEIYISGEGVARGYVGSPELTGEKFTPNPFCRKSGERWYRTGDHGRYRADGNIEFLGRADDQVKIRGYRIELGEIEARLSGHPEVREAVVVAREEEDGGKRLVAYYTGEEISPEALRAHLKSGLPNYMIPAAYVRLDSFPLTPNGKLDRRKLPAPEGGAYLRRGYEAPEGETERKLAQIWAEVLKVEQVGRQDNFFELGGHSLLVITVIERMKREGMQADVRSLFITPTLAEMAAGIGKMKEIIL